MGAAFEVYNGIGYGMAEDVYQHCLEVELTLRNIQYHPKQQLDVFYKNHKLSINYVPDLFVFAGIVVELKAVAERAAEHDAQLFNYMRIARQPVGYLVNFGHKGDLQWKRFLLSDLHKRLEH